jgi:TrmH family RNA methyltransferase
LLALFPKSENQHPCFQSIAHDFGESGGIREKKSETAPHEVRATSRPEGLVSALDTALVSSLRSGIPLQRIARSLRSCASERKAIPLLSTACALFEKTTREGVHPMTTEKVALAPYEIRGEVPGKGSFAGKRVTAPRTPRAFTPPRAFASLLNTMALAANARGRASRVPELITSRDNRWLKQFRAASAGEKPRDPASPDAEIVGVEGPHLVETALRAGLQVAAVLVSEAGARHLPVLGEWIPESTRLLATSDRLFAQVAATETPQGIAALVQAPQTCFDDLVRGVPLLLIMAGIQDPGNVGTLLRTAEAFGASGAAACPAGLIGTADPFGPKALRASAGSALRLPVLRGVGTPVLLAQLRVAGVRVYATSPVAACFAEARAGAGAGAPPYAASAAQSTGRESARKPLLPWEVNWREPSALLVGNEGAGLPADLIRSSDAVVHIPQAMAREAGAPVDSLNAAVAGAILLYEAARQRGLG